MTFRASGGDFHAPAPQDSATVWVISPHLLVAQAVAAALRSAGVAVLTASWEVANEGQESTGTARLAGGQVVVILDELDTALLGQVAHLVEAGPDRVMVVTSGTSTAWWGALLVTEAVEVVTMASSVDQLAHLVGQFVRGVPLTGPEERSELRAAWAEAMDTRRRAANLLATLTPQQLRVLELLASGRRVSEVGSVLGVANGTVRSHVKALRAKLGARSQLEAVAMFHQSSDSVGGRDLVPRPRQVSSGWDVATRR